MPAKAGIQNYLKTLDSRFRGNDVKGRFKTCYETINVWKFISFNGGDRLFYKTCLCDAYIYFAISRTVKFAKEDSLPGT